MRNREEIILSDEMGNKLKELLQTTKPGQMVDIQGDLYRASEIVKVEYAVDPAQDIYEAKDWSEVAQLMGNGCRGTNSIQNHINQIAQDTDIKLLKDDEWREKTRLELRAITPDGWCDYKENECACN